MDRQKRMVEIMSNNLVIRGKNIVKEDGSLHGFDPYIDWTSGGATITLDDNFTIDELEEIVKYCKNNLAGRGLRG